MEVYQAGSMEFPEGISSLAQCMVNGLALDMGMGIGIGMDIGTVRDMGIALNMDMDMVEAMDDRIAMAKVKQSLKVTNHTTQ